MSTPVVVDPDERAVEEVHCSECGVPISAIPAWYANVAVKFTCDQCRQKSPKLTAGLPVAETESPRSSAVDTDGEGEGALDDIDIEDADTEIDDADLDASEE